MIALIPTGLTSTLSFSPLPFVRLQASLLLDLGIDLISTPFSYTCPCILFHLLDNGVPCLLYNVVFTVCSELSQGHLCTSRVLSDVVDLSLIFGCVGLCCFVLDSSFVVHLLLVYSLGVLDLVTVFKPHCCLYDRQH